MPPPAPRPSKPNDGRSKPKQKGAPKNDRPKTMPQGNRDKCGACSQDHDIRYCPYPNTDDGRTKICPICNTTNHAWFECWHRKEEVVETFTICYENRRCLPVLVHDESLQAVFMAKVYRDQSRTGSDLKSILEVHNANSGPLSPAFVKTLMPPQAADLQIQQQIRDGRCAPWELDQEELVDSTRRTKKAFRDPSTVILGVDRITAGTASRTWNVPAAKKLGYFVELAQNEQDRNAALAETARRRSLALTQMPTIRTWASRRRKRPELRSAAGDMEVECPNCAASGHIFRKCPNPCKACGRPMGQHEGSIEKNKCIDGCLCRPYAGHTRQQCPRPCRLCIMENPESDTAIKDCQTHCHIHNLHMSNGNHKLCLIQHSSCGFCFEHHWPQDCPIWMQRICLFSGCHKLDCTVHCVACGGSNFDGIASLFPNNNNTAYRRRIEHLVRTWHDFLDKWQWERVPAPDAHNKRSAWSVLRCQRHKEFTCDALSLEKMRVSTWGKVVDCVRGGFTEKTVSEAERLLQIPECPDCRYKAETADSDTRAPGTMTS